jgi:hypothetical protein
MEQQEKQMITDLFSKLKQAEDQSGPRDNNAETFISETLAKQPSAPYYMAQAILVQEHALNNLNQRVQELEQELTKRPAGGGGFLGGLFGAGNNEPSRPPTTAPNASPFKNARQGSFLGSAMQTAVGVAGGMLLANAVSGLFAGDTAEAAPPAESEPARPPEEEAMGSQEDEGDWGNDFDMDEDF